MTSSVVRREELYTEEAEVSALEITNAQGGRGD